MYLFVYLAASSLSCGSRIFVHDVGSFLVERGLSRLALGLQSASAALLCSMWNLSSPDQGSIPRSLCWKVNS